MGDATWWQRGVIYQIYPRSFMDSDGDGVGDLPGILARLDHLSWLGVDAVWLPPVHPSPMDDFGYDVSDYTGVDPVFGTLDDMDELVAAAHRRGLRVLLDWVPNHTPTGTCGSRSRGRRATAPGGTGTSGATRGPAVARRATGCAMPATAPGAGTRAAASSTTVSSSTPSPT
jgi:alpha amylase-like protein